MHLKVVWSAEEARARAHVGKIFAEIVKVLLSCRNPCCHALLVECINYMSVSGKPRFCAYAQGVPKAVYFIHMECHSNFIGAVEFQPGNLYITCVKLRWNLRIRNTAFLYEAVKLMPDAFLYFAVDQIMREISSF